LSINYGISDPSCADELCSSLDEQVFERFDVLTLILKAIQRHITDAQLVGQGCSLFHSLYELHPGMPLTLSWVDMTCVYLISYLLFSNDKFKEIATIYFIMVESDRPHLKYRNPMLIFHRASG